MEWTYHLAEIRQTATKFWEIVPNTAVLAFHGPLGVGKTTFIKALCEIRGTEDVVSSPTFSLINDYLYRGTSGLEQHLFHMDLYRIRSEEEAIQAGIEDCLYSGSLCLVEWPEKIPGLLPPNTLHIYLSLLEGGKRKCTIQC